MKDVATVQHTEYDFAKAYRSRPHLQQSLILMCTVVLFHHWLSCIHSLALSLFAAKDL